MLQTHQKLISLLSPMTQLYRGLFEDRDLFQKGVIKKPVFTKHLLGALCWQYSHEANVLSRRSGLASEEVHQSCLLRGPQPTAVRQNQNAERGCWARPWRWGESLWPRSAKAVMTTEEATASARGKQSLGSFGLHWEAAVMGL